MTDNAASTAELLKLSSYVCFALAILFLVLAVVLFFRLKVRDVIYELSGKAKIESIEKMTKDYAVTGSLSSTGERRIGEADEAKGLMNTAPLAGNKGGAPQANTAPSAPPPIEETSILPRRQAVATNTASTNFVVTKDIVVVHTHEQIM